MIASTTRSQLHHCLNAVDFPANKDDLITAAVRSRCDDDTVHALQAVEPATYNNAEQVLAQASIVDPQTPAPLPVHRPGLNRKDKGQQREAISTQMSYTSFSTIIRERIASHGSCYADFEPTALAVAIFVATAIAEMTFKRRIFGCRDGHI